MGENVLDLMDQAELEIIVPYDTEFNLADHVASFASNLVDERDDTQDPHELSALASIPSRTTLYFDEHINVVVVLRTPSRLKEPQRQLSYLTIHLEVQALGSESKTSNVLVSNGQSGQPPSRDVIWSGTVDRAQQPITIHGMNHEAYVWSLSCFLSRPKIRMQHPMISFKALGTFRQPQSSIAAKSGDRLLPSGIPVPINVLEPLSGDRELQGINPQLTALRLDRISTTTSVAATEQSVRSKPQKLFPALPAISARVRYSKSGASPGPLATIASLDVEISPFQDQEIQLTEANMQLSGGSAEDICAGRAINLPVKCHPRDNIIFLFRLLLGNNYDPGSRSNSLTRPLDIWINAKVLVSNTCRPDIQMRWRTTVDFSAALNRNYGGPSQTLQRNNRPSSLPLATDGENREAFSRASDTALNSMDKSQQRATAIPEFGVTMTLTAPRDVYIGQPFTWDVFLVNRSDKARKLAILVIPERRAVDHKSQMSKTSMSSTFAGQRGGVDHADVVMDENRLYALQKSNRKDPVRIVCLSTDVRIGNLNPRFCHNTELKFLPLSKGILHIDAVRVVDVLTNETMEIRDLPEIVAEERGLDDKEPA
ncbi:MAG: hypothetical protein Q9213_003501 [Squamulea squamosa]